MATHEAGARNVSSDMTILALLLALVALVPQASDFEKGMRAKEDATRLATVALLASESDPKTEKLLLTALKDIDWEVVERSIDALGARGSKAATGELTKLALEAPLRLHRAAAARALARIDAKGAATELVKKAAGATETTALEALAIVVRGAPSELDLKGVVKIAEKGKESPTRALAQRVLAAHPGPERAARIRKVLESDGILAACAVLDEIADHPLAGDLELAAKLLERDELNDVVERRGIVAARVCIAGPDSAEATWSPIVERLIAAKSGLVSARGARLVRELSGSYGPATQGGTGELVPDPRAFEMLKPALEHPDPTARAAAAKALARLTVPAAIESARALAVDDKSETVRYPALESLCRLAPIAEGNNASVVVKILETDADKTVRMLAATKLGVRTLSTGVDALQKALKGESWSLAVVSAVSLGRTQLHEPVQTLVGVAQTHADWKLRAAALIGLSQAYDKASIPPAIAALADPDPAVLHCAWSLLKTVSGESFPAKVEPWQAWWAANEKSLILADPEVVAARRKRFADSGTAAPEIFRELDVVVVESRGDHIENVLKSQSIPHRMTRAGALAESGLSQDALLMMNCSGEIEGPDVERVRWFVLTGGHLFGTCWALHETITRSMPDAPIAKFETSGEVMASVPASPCDEQSPYTEGVFPNGVVPIYALLGAHLIRVLEPERAEVLVDSPRCAEDHGSGNLAAWFELGHGTVLDSVNHFDLQGLEQAEGLKTARDRQAYAIDHMGYSYESLRKSRAENFWDRSNKASAAVLDLSVFRLLTNFVRMRRAEITKS